LACLGRLWDVGSTVRALSRTNLAESAPGLGRYPSWQTLYMLGWRQIVVLAFASPPLFFFWPRITVAGLLTVAFVSALAASNNSILFLVSSFLPRPVTEVVATLGAPAFALGAVCLGWPGIILWMALTWIIDNWVRFRTFRAADKDSETLGIPPIVTTAFAGVATLDTFAFHAQTRWVIFCAAATVLFLVFSVLDLTGLNSRNEDFGKTVGCVVMLVLFVWIMVLLLTSLLTSGTPD
jgi:hypothetical protein